MANQNSSSIKNCRGYKQFEAFALIMSSPSVDPDKWMDHFEAPLNPCSIETLPEAVIFADGSSAWPLMLSCYQLDDAVQEQQERLGQLNLYMVKVPDASLENVEQSLAFGEPHVIMSSTNDTNNPQKTSGILDGKWAVMPSRPNKEGKSWAFATAHSSGDIRIHGLHVPTSIDDESNSEQNISAEQLFQVTELGASQSSASVKEPTESNPLCLSLNWETTTNCVNDAVPARHNRIVSSYSNGIVAIHNVHFSNGKATLVESDSWLAHTMFKSPAEVWSVCFADSCFGSKAVVSCGDDGLAKVWDLRATDRPMQTLQHFDAGVTCVAPHPRLDYLMVMGSYDETICLYDTRYMKPLCKSSALGGGIWRLKWHPLRNDRLLVAAMHGGARVVDFDGLDSYAHASMSENEMGSDSPTPATIPESSPTSSSNMISYSITKEFCEHKSMCYGADWLVHRQSGRDGPQFEAAATCSFYDKATYLWSVCKCRV
ncbi:hypothetical protein MPSEU_000166900 [Mayamaea pseudoterrestris]|nr:hypothetical protein MPSEU_000166900 [Mayamaea pseudoterrestris]